MARDRDTEAPGLRRVRDRFGAARAAKRIGVSLTEYNRRRAAGDKWCSKHGRWEPGSGFGPGQHSCRAAHAERSLAEHHKRIDARRAGLPVAERPCRRRVPPRDGDVPQAQRRIAQLVAGGKLPHPNRVACWLCGHVAEGPGKDHGYFHYKGYAAEHHETVRVLCSTCCRSLSKHPKSARRLKPARAGDAAQARQRVDCLVRAGVLPRADTLPCSRCGHEPDGTKRHGYHHHRGYAPEHHEDVVVVCANCRTKLGHEHRRAAGGEAEGEARG